MYLLVKIIFFTLFYTFLISCSADKSGFVDVPEDHGDEIKLAESLDDIKAPKAGSYNNLLLAIDSNKISGLYTTAGQSCYFIESEFTAFNAETTLKWRQVGTNQSGEGKFTAQKDAVWIQFKGNPTGCAPELFKTALKLPLSKINNWQKISSVSKTFVEISSEPLEDMKNGQSFKKGDIICILEQKKGWLRVEKIAQSPQVGWIKASELEN